MKDEKFEQVQNSSIKGQRYLTDRTRRAEQAERDREEIMEMARRAQEINIARSRRNQKGDDE